MELKEIRMPTLPDDMPNGRKIQLLAEHMRQVESTLRFVLRNIDADNLGKELDGTIRKIGKRVELSAKKDGLISAINLSPEEIRIRAARLALEGLTTINGYFKVLLDGSFEATAGRIGGWTVGAGELFTGENDAQHAPTLYAGTRDVQKPVAIAGSSERADWRLKVGDQFGVTKDGAVYAGSGVFRGQVSAANILSGTGDGGESYGKLDGGALVDGSVGEVQMEAAYAQMKQFFTDAQTFFNMASALLDGAAWATATIDGSTIQYLGR